MKADSSKRWTRAMPTVVALTITLASGASAQRPPFVVHDLDFEFYRDRVEPILYRDRGGFGPGQSACVTCHSHSNTPLSLQPLESDQNGDPYWTEEQSLLNFVVVSGLVTPGRPEQSLLLRTPLAVEAGGIPFHVGGKFWESRDDPDWQVLAQWVETADSTAPSAAADARFVPSFEFFRDCVQRIFLDREERNDRTECIACHGSGPRGFAQTLPEGRDYWTEEESRENFIVLMRYVEPGFPLRSRFLSHPLAVDAGGDGGHSGGRRWLSQDDPEWQMLADWVRGRTPACVVQDR